MYITKQILNEKQRKLMRPHKRQILNEIKTSIDHEDWQISRQLSFMDDTAQKPKNNRPKTAKSSSLSEYSSNSKLVTRCASAQNIERKSRSFMKKINYKFKQIKKISSLFDNFFKIKKKKIQPQKIKFPQHVKAIKDDLMKKQKQQIQSFQKMKRQRFSKHNENQANQYIGYPKEKVNKIISVAKAKNQDVKMITRCIKGGYFSESDELSDVVNKNEIIKLNKNFITMNTLYEGIKGRKNKGISQMRPQSVGQSSLKNLVYFLQNQKNLKYADKIAMQEKMKLIA